MLKTLKKEELAWKIIRDKKDNYFLVEVSLPKGTKVVKKRKKEKFRADQAMVNYITEIESLELWGQESALLWFLHGNLSKTIVQLTKSKNKVKHCAAFSEANNITYEVGKIIKPDYFSLYDVQCASGLHFYPANKINYLEII